MSDRAVAAFKALVREFLSPDASDGAPVWAFWVPWEYSVSEATDTTFSGRATSERCPHPDLVEVPLMPGIAGVKVKPAVGSRVCVTFINGDPSRPAIVHWDQATPETVTQDTSQTHTFSPSTTRMRITSVGVEVGNGLPAAQAVALAPAVTSFASAAVTLSAAMATAWGAVATYATAAGVAVPALAPAGGVLATAAGVAAAAWGSFGSAVGALVGTFPTGFTATKLSTQ